MRGQCTTDRGKEEGECNVAACEGNREEVQTQTIFGDRLKRSILRTVECRDDRRVAENEQGIDGTRECEHGHDQIAHQRWRMSACALRP